MTLPLPLTLTWQKNDYVNSPWFKQLSDIPLAQQRSSSPLPTAPAPSPRIAQLLPSPNPDPFAVPWDAASRPSACTGPGRLPSPLQFRCLASLSGSRGGEA